MTTRPSFATAGILAGHTEGHYDLPPDLLVLADARQRVITDRQTPAPAFDEAAYSEACVEAAIAGEPLPDVAPLVDAARTREASQRRGVLLDDAATRLTRRLDHAVSSRALELLTDWLRPRWDAHATAAHRALVTIGTVDLTDRRAVAAAPDKVRRAVLAYDQAVTALPGVLAAADSLRRHAGLVPVLDTEDYCRHLTAATVRAGWPQLATTRLPLSTIPRPWSDLDSLVRFAAAQDQPLTLHTPEEQDREHRVLFAERYAALQSNRGQHLDPDRTLHERYGKPGVLVSNS